MQIAQMLAGYTLGGADLLRRAMGKKIKAEMDAQRETLHRRRGRASERRPAPSRRTIFDLVDKFAGYGFNKCHAAAYALVAYQTAWLKANHPVEFFAASMTSTSQHRQARVFRQELTRSGIALLPPDVNRSEPAFIGGAAADGTLRDALCAGGGEERRRRGDGGHGADARGAAGRSASLFDFCRARRPQALNKRQLENLVAAGAFDAIHPQPRAGLRGGRADAAPGGRRDRGAHQHADQPVRRRRRGRASTPVRDARLVADGAAAARVRRHRLLSLGPPARRLWRQPEARSMSSRIAELGSLAALRAAAAGPRSPACAQQAGDAPRPRATASPSCSCPTRPACTR